MKHAQLVNSMKYKATAAIAALKIRFQLSGNAGNELAQFKGDIGLKRIAFLSAVALLAQLLAGAASAQTPNPAPSVAQVGNSSVIAAVGGDGSLWFYWQTIGTGPWNPEQVAGSGTASSASVAQVGNSSVIAAVGGDGSLWFYWQTIGTGPWHAEQVPAGSGTTLSASVAQVGNSSVIAAVGGDGSLWFYWQTIGTGPWHPEQVPAGSGSPFTCAHCNDGSCQCGNQTGPQLCASHGGYDPSIGCVQQESSLTRRNKTVCTSSISVPVTRVAGGL